MYINCELLRSPAIVSSLWAIVMTVRFENFRRMVFWINWSVHGSTLAVASSISKIFESFNKARARQTSCRCPTIQRYQNYRSHKKVFRIFDLQLKEFDRSPSSSGLSRHLAFLSVFSIRHLPMLATVDHQLMFQVDPNFVARYQWK